MMDYFFRRVLAYYIDMFLVSIVVSSIISSSIINFQLEDYNKYYNEYLELYNIYYEQSNNDIKICKELDTAISKEKLTEDKYVSKYKDLSDSLTKEEISQEEFDSSCLSIIEEYNSNKITEEEYLEKVDYYYYHTENNSLVAYIVNIIICVLYFVFFQGFTYGQTLGKKIMRLKVVSVDGNNVTYKQLFTRSIFLFSILLYIFTIISILFIPESMFSNITNFLYLLNTILFLSIGFTIVFDKDKRGLHGMISRTKVIMVDFKGNEISTKEKKSEETVDENTKMEDKDKSKKTKKVNKSKKKEK